MGLDLSLYPLEPGEGVLFYCSSILACERREMLFRAIQIYCKTYQLGCMARCYFSGKYKTIKETPYGDLLEYAFAKDLVKFSQHPGVLDNDLNRAVWAYISALNPETKIILYWR